MQHDEYGQATTRRLDQAMARIAELEARNAELAARLVQLERPGKTPGNFSRPATKGQKPDGPAYAALRSVVSTAEANRRSVLDSLRSAFAAPPANRLSHYRGEQLPFRRCLQQLRARHTDAA